MKDYEFIKREESEYVPTGKGEFKFDSIEDEERLYKKVEKDPEKEKMIENMFGGNELFPIGTVIRLNTEFTEYIIVSYDHEGYDYGVRKLYDQGENRIKGINKEDIEALYELGEINEE